MTLGQRALDDCVRTYLSFSLPRGRLRGSGIQSICCCASTILIRLVITSGVVDLLADLHSIQPDELLGIV